MCQNARIQEKSALKDCLVGANFVVTKESKFNYFNST